MALNITATIVNLQGAPLVGLDAQVIVFAPIGKTKIAGTGKTDDKGLLPIVTGLVFTEYQPRVQLRLLRDGVFIEASEDPVSFTDTLCDLGKVTFSLSADAIPTRGGDLEAERTALIKDLEAQSARALTTRTSELTAEKTAALAALAQQLAADKAAALAARTQELTAARDLALAKRTQELAADKTAALAVLAGQHAQELAARDAALATRDGEISELQHQIDVAAADAPHESSIEDLAQITASQIQRVQQTLRSDQSGLQLGKVSLSLKVMPGKLGGRVTLPQTRDIEKVGAAALGSLDLSFLPDAAATRPRTQLTAPRVLGYTEALARRKLAERGLGVDVIHQLVTSAADHGRVVLQKPPPAAPLAEGTTVLIAIGRKDEHDPRQT